MTLEDGPAVRGIYADGIATEDSVKQHFFESAAGIAVHLACGFRLLGRRMRVAAFHGVWRDTVLAERRGTLVDAA